MAMYHPLTGYEPNVLDDFHYSETSAMIFQDESGDIDTEPSYLCDAELDDETIGKALRQSFYEEELRLAWKRRDLAATFRWSRLLGGRRWGAKKRDYRAMSAALPLKKAWKDEWTKPGAEGGMGAVELESWYEWRIQSRDLARRSELNARVSDDARWDFKELKNSYRTVKKRRACPAGTQNRAPR